MSIIVTCLHSLQTARMLDQGFGPPTGESLSQFFKSHPQVLHAVRIFGIVPPS